MTARQYTIHDPHDGPQCVETLAHCEPPAHPQETCLIAGPGWRLTHKSYHQEDQ